MLTREMSRAFLHSYPPTAAEREHVEELYNDTFARDGAKTVHFLTQAGIVLKKAGSIGNPRRPAVVRVRVRVRPNLTRTLILTLTLALTLTLTVALTLTQNLPLTLTLTLTLTCGCHRWAC